MKICHRLERIEKADKCFRIFTDAVEFRLIFLTDDILRIRAGFDGDFAEESYSLVMTAWEDRMDGVLKDYRKRIEPADAFISETADASTKTTDTSTSETANTSTYAAADYVMIQGRKLHIKVYKEPFMLQILDADGTVLHEDIPYMGWKCDGNDRRTHTCVMEEDDAFYGFGERTGELNKREKYMTSAPSDAMGYNPRETDSLYKHIPFYIKLNSRTKKAVGYFYHTTWECDFNMGRSHSNYVRHHSSVRMDGGDIDLFFIAGPLMKDVISRYTDLTGKSVMLPKTAFGYLGSSMYYPELPKDADKAILEFIQTSKEEKIPIDGFQLSSGYCELDAGEGPKRYTFTWNHQKFSDPKDFFRKMNDMGITVSPNIKPGFLLSHPYIHEMLDKKMFIRRSEDDDAATGLWWGGMGYYVDFTDEKTRLEWKEYIKRNLLDYGVTSIWNDNCEYEGLFDTDSRVSFEGKGATIGQLKPVMSNMMCQFAQESIHEEHPDERAFVVCRSGHSGIQRYAQTWAGDNLTCWESLKYNIATILGMGISGVANHGCDIGGFYGPAPEEELFVRWVQNGIFQPRFSIHSTNTDNTVTEPWMYSNSKKYIRRAIELRYRLEPYFYSLMKRAADTGLPIMEPLVLEFQNDPDCYNEGVNFMLGESLLVANVVEKGAAQKTVYLPKGADYYDFYTRKYYKGGQTIAIPVTLESIPLYLKSGAILPMDTNQMYNLATETVTALKLLCVPDRDAAFTLYDDDGCTMNYQKGLFRQTKISMKSGTFTTLNFTSTGDYESRIESIYVDMVCREKAPYRVNLNETELPHFLNRGRFESAECGWYYSQTLKSVQIKYRNPKEDHELMVSFETFDLIKIGDSETEP